MGENVFFSVNTLRQNLSESLYEMTGQHFKEEGL